MGWRIIHSQWLVELGNDFDAFIEDLQRIASLSFAKFEDHESYSMYQNLGLGGPSSGDMSGIYGAEASSYFMAYMQALIIQHAGNPGGEELQLFQMKVIIHLFAGNLMVHFGSEIETMFHTMILKLENLLNIWNRLL